jgi:hypothetical protein
MRPGDIRVVTGDVCVFKTSRVGGAGAEGTALVDSEGCLAATLLWHASSSNVVIIERRNQPPVRVREALTPHGTGRWVASVGGVHDMSMIGDLLADSAVVIRGERVIAEAFALGRREYVVTLASDTDPVLAVSLVLAVDHLGR